MTPHDEPARDAWLSQALRHAPDAHGVPPAELSEAILRQARNAVKAPQAARHAHANALLRLWSWLARPPVAAGFATLTVATLVGVMWWDEPLDVSLPRPAAPAASTPAGPIAQAPAAATPRPPRDETKTAEFAQTQAGAARSAAVAAQPAAKRERAIASRSAVAASGELREQHATAAPPVPAAAPEPLPAAAADAAATNWAGMQAREEATDRRDAPAQRLAKAAPAAAAATSMSTQRQAADARTPVIDQPEQWRWQRGAGPQPMTPALQRWLAQLDRAALWRPATGTAPTVADGNLLRLWRDGALRATIALFDDAVWLTSANAAPAMAPLAPAVAASLKAALLEAAP